MVRVEDSVVMNFKVDGLGFRRFKEVVGQYQRWFVYDMGSSETPGLAPLVAEYDESGNLVAKYHYDGGGLMAMTRNNQSYWYGFEGIGTVRQLMGSQGQVVDAYAFDAWGNEITNPQSQIPNPFKYVGKHGYYLDTESALMLLGVRCYNAEVGRFVSLDPIKDGKNWYRYVSNNPCNYIDPTGLLRRAICPQGSCETDNPNDIATCCPDGRPYCGPPSMMESICVPEFHRSPFCNLPNPPTPNQLKCLDKCMDICYWVWTISGAISCGLICGAISAILPPWGIVCGVVCAVLVGGSTEENCSLICGNICSNF